jgi:hypothetical protein
MGRKIKGKPQVVADENVEKHIEPLKQNFPK